jgi:HPt (histidine-containing phosphotransfer) domain-containing protein
MPNDITYFAGGTREMYDELLTDLKDHGADVEGALNRFVGSTELYEKFLMLMPEDENFSQIAPAMEKGDHEAELTAVHTLKGVSGNLGLTALYEACSSMVALIRAGSFDEAEASYAGVKAAYDEVCGILASH